MTLDRVLFIFFTVVFVIGVAVCFGVREEGAGVAQKKIVGDRSPFIPWTKREMEEFKNATR